MKKDAFWLNQIFSYPQGKPIIKMQPIRTAIMRLHHMVNHQNLLFFFTMKELRLLAQLHEEGCFLAEPNLFLPRKENPLLKCNTFAPLSCAFTTWLAIKTFYFFHHEEIKTASTVA